MLTFHKGRPSCRGQPPSMSTSAPPMPIDHPTGRLPTLKRGLHSILLHFCIVALQSRPQLQPQDQPLVWPQLNDSPQALQPGRLLLGSSVQHNRHRDASRYPKSTLCSNAAGFPCGRHNRLTTAKHKAGSRARHLYPATNSTPNPGSAHPQLCKPVCHFQGTPCGNSTYQAASDQATHTQKHFRKLRTPSPLYARPSNCVTS